MEWGWGGGGGEHGRWEEGRRASGRGYGGGWVGGLAQINHTQIQQQQTVSTNSPTFGSFNADI